MNIDMCYEMLSSGHDMAIVDMNSLKLYKICVRSSHLKIPAQKEWFQMAIPELQSKWMAVGGY